MMGSLELGSAAGTRVAWTRIWRGDGNAEGRLAELGIDPVTARALVAEETRPRAIHTGDGALVILRGVNANGASGTQDMVSVRLWIDGGKVVSVQLRKLQAVDELADEVAAGKGPEGPGEFLNVLADRLTDRMQDTVDHLDMALDRLEVTDAGAPPPQLRAEIARVRRRIGMLRRFIAPQRDALEVLVVEPFEWQNPLQERRLAETVDRITRLVEQLDEMHLRAAVAQESLSGYVAEKLNRTMVLLSVIAGIFMPLGFVTGLLGMNLAGIPYAESDWAFLTVAAVLVAFGGFEYWLFRRLGLF